MQSARRASCSGFGLGLRTRFLGKGSVREGKCIESGWNASDPRRCPRAFSRGAPRTRGLQRLVGALTFLPFHTPIKPRLNPSASQPLAPGVAVLFSLVFYILIEVGDLEALHSLNRLNRAYLFIELLQSPTHTCTCTCTLGRCFTLTFLFPP